MRSLSRGLLILRVTLGVLTSAAALNGPVRPEKISRRTLLAGALATPLLVAGPLKGSASADEPRDPRTAWSFFGLVAPPIQGTWSYDTLVDQAKADNLATIQTAVSHDCIIATTHDGMRFASMVADKAVPSLLIDVEKPDGSLPFLVLPIDENRAAVRDVATQFLNLLGVLWLADQADLLPWDTTPYGSIAEREAAQRGGEKVKKKLLGQLRSALEKKKKAPARREAASCTCARACPALLPRCLLWLRLPRTARAQRWPLELSQRRETCMPDVRRGARRGSAPCAGLGALGCGCGAQGED